MTPSTRSSTNASKEKNQSADGLLGGVSPTAVVAFPSSHVVDSLTLPPRATSRQPLPASDKSIRTKNPIRAIVDPIVANVQSGRERGDGKDLISLAVRTLDHRPRGRDTTIVAEGTTPHDSKIPSKMTDTGLVRSRLSLTTILVPERKLETKHSLALVYSFRSSVHSFFWAILYNSWVIPLQRGI
jgi:hypothetical protein